MRHIISVLLENESGALSRVAGLFSARGYNIESLTVAPTNDETLSRLTLVTTGNDQVIEQIEKQLNKLVDVAKLHDLTNGKHIERELMLVKVRVKNEMKEGLDKLIDVFVGRLIEQVDEIYTIEITGTAEKVDAMIDALQKFEIIELARSGVIGLASGERSLTV